MGHTKNSFQGVKADGPSGRRTLATGICFVSALSIFLLASVSLCQADEEKHPRSGKPAISASAALRPFEHRLILHPYRGLPSELIFTPREKIPVQVRGLFVLDGVLLVVPFRHNRGQKHFVAVFPTPKKTLRYQFQMVFDGGKTLLSEVFAANPQCSSVEAEQMVRKAKSFRHQQKLLREAIALDRDVVVIQYLIQAIDNILKR